MHRHFCKDRFVDFAYQYIRKEIGTNLSDRGVGLIGFDTMVIDVNQVGTNNRDYQEI